MLFVLVYLYSGCYGVSENQSVGSTVSSASTEPWFCDACKAGVKPVRKLYIEILTDLTKLVLGKCILNETVSHDMDIHA